MLNWSSFAHTNKSKPDYFQLFVWQAAIMLLNFGIIFFIAGLAIQVVTDLLQKWSTDDIKESRIFSNTGTFTNIYSRLLWL